MGMQIRARFIAAATLTLLLAVPQAQAGDKMGKEIRVQDVLKGRKTVKTVETGKTGKPGKTGKAAARQTARTPAEGGDEGGFGVERPAPEGPDPNEVKGVGERPLDGGSGAGGKGDGAPPDDS